MNKRLRLMPILMAIMMVFTMMPMVGAPVYADDPAPPAPGIALGSDVLSVGSNTSGAATVHMAGTKWRVIGYNGSGVASSADTITLISAGNLETGVQFRDDWEASDANHYDKSNLKTEIETLTDENNGIFSAGETAGIVPRTLEKGSYISSSPYTNGIAGDEVKDALLWPLSTQEAYHMDSELRRASDYWWLRSPGDGRETAAVVEGDDGVYLYGYYVHDNLGVRPAFNFNLESVIFTSAAVGGKTSGDVGAGSLKSVEPNSNNEWKLTLESGHDDFEVENVSTCDGKTVNIKYSGAVVEEGEYISAIITDENDAVKYYGNLIEFADEDSASGTAKVTIDGKMESTDKLYVFNEQLNGDEKTDYSSALNEIIIPSPTDHTWSIEWSKDGENHWHECSACGEKKDEVAHTWNTEWSTDGDKHWHECTVCHEKKDEAVHTWDAGKVTKNATTTATGIKTHTCTACKATKTVTIPKLAKKANPLSIKAKTATVKGSTKGKNGKLKKTKTLAVSKVIAFTKKGQGKMTYTKSSGNKKITINKTTGKVTVKKGLKKGIYKVKVKVKAAGNTNYKASAWKTVTFKVKVK